MYRIHAKNAAGQELFIGEASTDAIQWAEFATAGAALTFGESLRSAMRYDENAGRFLRNRVAQFRLVHPNGHSEIFAR